jgi:hypothetical protein
MKCKNAIFLVCAVKLLASEDLKAVHEWGTFTSVAGEDGAAMAWQTLSGPSDLPCFVHHLDQRNSKLADFGTVRMETPVLYFYPLKPLTISAHVEFPSGRITEWYPQAALAPMGSRSSSIDWQNVQLGAAATFPTLNQPSHYYAARETDASPLSTGQETEKLLFYRGIADFGVDLNAIVHPDGVSLRNQGIETIPEAILFENHSGQIGYTVIRNLREPANVQFSALAGTLDSLRSHLEQQLTEMGLYSKEAHAMVETWRDSWFEEGLRVFYILPRSKVDTLLPISIQPARSQLARVFVGRIELLSPQMRQEVATALTTSDFPVLKKYGRFLTAFLRQMTQSNAQLPMSEPSRQFINDLYTQAQLESQKLSCTP